VFPWRELSLPPPQGGVVWVPISPNFQPSGLESPGLLQIWLFFFSRSLASSVCLSPPFLPFGRTFLSVLRPYFLFHHDNSLPVMSHLTFEHQFFSALSVTPVPINWAGLFPTHTRPGRFFAALARLFSRLFPSDISSLKLFHDPPIGFPPRRDPLSFFLFPNFVQFCPRSLS